MAGRLLSHYRVTYSARVLALGASHPRTVAAEAVLRLWAGHVIGQGL